MPEFATGGFIDATTAPMVGEWCCPHATGGHIPPPATVTVADETFLPDAAEAYHPLSGPPSWIVEDIPPTVDQPCDGEDTELGDCALNRGHRGPHRACWPGFDARW